MIKKLTKMPHAHACVIYVDNNNFSLYSYTTPVVTVKDGKLHVTGLYSATTRRHTGAFMQEYCKSSYAFAKQLYLDGYDYDINTGEVM